MCVAGVHRVGAEELLAAQVVWGVGLGQGPLSGSHSYPASPSHHMSLPVHALVRVCVCVCVCVCVSGGGSQ